MPHVLHVIECLDKNEVAQATISTARQSARFGSYEHSIVSLNQADPAALEQAKDAKIEVYESPSISLLDSLIDDADILQIEYWNAPAINELLHTSLPPHRLAIWFHVAGSSSPHIIHQKLFDLADLPIASGPTLFNEHPAFVNARDAERAQEPAMVLAPADFDMLKNLSPEPHSGFNIGYIGNLDFETVHQDFISMNVNIQIPDSSFIICGQGTEAEFKQQVQSFNAIDRFDFRNDTEDVGSILKILDVFGFPLREDTHMASSIRIQEVMYAGIPPIVFPHGGIKGLVQHNRTGLFVNSGEDYRRAIEYLFYNPVERKRLGVNAAAYARAHFGAKNSARAINKVYDRLLKTPKRYHSWGAEPQPFAPRLSNKSPENKSAAFIFTESLGNANNHFTSSLQALASQEQLEADRFIAACSDQVYTSGIQIYRAHNPGDPHLSMWAGLHQEQQGLLTEALKSFKTASDSNKTGWRSLWYMGRTLNRLQEIDEAQSIYAKLRKEVPNFVELTGDNSFTSSESEVISFSTSGNKTPGQQSAADNENDIVVSAIVSTYNSESFMDGCLHNLVNQSLYKEGALEIIVIDACSEENEKEIVERYLTYYDNIVYVRAETRETLYASWNRGINLARGRYITNANTDDRHRHDALEKLANYLDDYPEIALTYPGQIDTPVPNETFENTSSKKVLDWPVYSYQELEVHCIIGSQPMWRKSLHDLYGPFRDSFQAAGDYEFWLRIGSKETFFRYPEVLGLYYRNPAGIEHGSNVSKKETLQIWKEYGMFDRGIPVILNGRILTSADDFNEGTPQELISDRLPFDSYINEFEDYLLAGEFNSAFEVADTASTHYPELPYPYILKAIALRQLQDFTGALVTLETSIQITETPEALVELIQLSLATGNLGEAYKTEQYVLESYPEWKDRLPGIEAPENVAQVHEDPISENEESIAQEIDTVDLLQEIEEEQLLLTDQESEPEEKLVLRLNDFPSSSEQDIAALETEHHAESEKAQQNLAFETEINLTASVDLFDPKEELSKPAGLQDLDYSIKSFQELRDEFEQLIKVKDVQHAEELALAATRKFPDNHQSWVLKATTYRLKGSFEEAKEALKKSLLIKDSPEALIELLELSLSLGDHEEALQICEAISRSYPEYNSLISQLKKNRLSDSPKKPVILSQVIRNFMPLPPEQRALIEADDFCLVSYPGSGSSKAGNMLADMLQQEQGYSTSPGHLAVPPAEIIIDLHAQKQRSTWLPNHEYKQQIVKTFDIATVSQNRMVYLYRDPLEALISAYHFYREVPHLNNRASTSCDAFCAANIESYNQHLSAALMIKQTAPEQVLLIDHKNLIDNPVDTLRSIFQFIGLEFEEKFAVQASSNCNTEQFLLDKNKEFPTTLTGLDFLESGYDLSRLTLDNIMATLIPIYLEISVYTNTVTSDEPLIPTLGVKTEQLV